MKKRSFKIGHLPKYEGGGGFFGGAESKFDFASFLNSTMGSMGQQPGQPGQPGQAPMSEEEADMAEFQAKYGKGMAKGEKTADSIQSGLSAIPGWGQLAAAGMEIGQQIGKATKDEFGVYKSKAGSVVDNILNPSTHMSRLTGDHMSQKELRRARDVFHFNNINEKAGKNERAGAVLKNSLPVYQAPAYGEEGLKLRVGKRYSSKFSNFK